MPKLSICVVTMNRAEQLKTAFESCFRCALPEETEFVVVDNASTDATEETLRELFSCTPWHLVYVKNNENLGAGQGRNMYYTMSTGDYVYGMDDDAVIDFQKNPDFFLRAISIFEAHPDIVSLATQIFDEMWGCNRQTIQGAEIAPGLYKCKMFCGGSHFLRKSFFKSPPYFPNVYGYEELPPSLLAWDEGKINAFCPDLLAIHQPKTNKWDWTNEKNFIFLASECAIPYSIKRMMYPKIYTPFLFLAYKVRCKKYLKSFPGGQKRADAIVKETYLKYPYKKRIKCKTVLLLYKEFGKSIF